MGHKHIGDRCFGILTVLGVMAAGGAAASTLEGWADLHAHWFSNIVSDDTAVFVDDPTATTWETQAKRALKGVEYPDVDVKAWNDVDQKAFIQWIHRAWEYGMRLSVVHIVYNDEQCKSWFVPGKHLGERCAVHLAVRDQLEQIRKLERFADKHFGGFLRIARSPQEARKWIQQGKLAVVIGLEVDDLGRLCRSYDLTDPVDDPSKLPACTKDRVEGMLDWLYAEGVRHLFVVHGIDTIFAGAAALTEAYGVNQRSYNGKHFELTLCDDPDVAWTYRGVDGFELILPVPEILVGVFKAYGNPAETPSNQSRIAAALAALGVTSTSSAGSVVVPGHCNARGLQPLGRHLVKEAMRRGMLIDVDHMSSKTFDDVYAMATDLKLQASLDRSGPYPLMSSHFSLRELNPHARAPFNVAGIAVPARMAQSTFKGIPERYLRTYAAAEMHQSVARLQKIAKTGGMVAPILVQRTVGSYKGSLKAPDNDCDGSVKSWAQMYLTAVEVMGGKGVGLGTDVNGMAVQPMPRFGPNACAGDATYEHIISEYEIAAAVSGVTAAGGCAALAMVPIVNWFACGILGGKAIALTARLLSLRADLKEWSKRLKKQRSFQKGGVVYGQTTLRGKTLTQLQTGNKKFDYNTEGVAHLGLVPDMLADLEALVPDKTVLEPLWHSAEAYAQRWESAQPRDHVDIVSVSKPLYAGIAKAPPAAAAVAACQAAGVFQGVGLPHDARWWRFHVVFDATLGAFTSLNAKSVAVSAKVVQGTACVDIQPAGTPKTTTLRYDATVYVPIAPAMDSKLGGYDLRLRFEAKHTYGGLSHHASAPVELHVPRPELRVVLDGVPTVGNEPCVLPKVPKNPGPIDALRYLPSTRTVYVPVKVEVRAHTKDFTPLWTVWADAQQPVYYGFGPNASIPLCPCAPRPIVVYTSEVAGLETATLRYEVQPPEGKVLVHTTLHAGMALVDPNVGCGAMASSATVAVDLEDPVVTTASDPTVSTLSPGLTGIGPQASLGQPPMCTWSPRPSASAGWSVPSNGTCQATVHFGAPVDGQVPAGGTYVRVERGPWCSIVAVGVQAGASCPKVDSTGHTVPIGQDWIAQLRDRFAANPPISWAQLQGALEEVLGGSWPIDEQTWVMAADDQGEPTVLLTPEGLLLPSYYPGSDGLPVWAPLAFGQPTTMEEQWSRAVVDVRGAPHDVTVTAPVDPSL